MNSANRTSAAAIVSLIFGILSWVLLPLVGAVVAVIAGHVARSEIRRLQLEGDGMAIAGLILGYLNLSVLLLGLALLIAIFGLGILVAILA